MFTDALFCAEVWFDPRTIYFWLLSCWPFVVAADETAMSNWRVVVLSRRASLRRYFPAHVDRYRSRASRLLPVGQHPHCLLARQLCQSFAGWGLQPPFEAAKLITPSKQFCRVGETVYSEHTAKLPNKILNIFCLLAQGNLSKLNLYY